jgi:methylated-DNA-[protein]-cysteine S-methyltransferase
MHAMKATRYHHFVTPLAPMLVTASPGGVSMLNFCSFSTDDEEAVQGFLASHHPGELPRFSAEDALLQQVQAAVLDYFHSRRPLDAFPLDLERGTAFQREVWQALAAIPFGQTRSYGEVARAIGKERASRAVGHACGRNPVVLLIPCHRVVAAGGGLGGFTGGLHLKRALLELEAGKTTS